MDLYKRLIEEKEPLGPEEERHRQERASGERRMAAYIKRKETEDLPPGLGPYGHITREELEEERRSYTEDLKVLARLMLSGPRSLGVGYRYAGLRNRYKREYEELRNELLGYGNFRQDDLL